MPVRPRLVTRDRRVVVVGAGSTGLVCAIHLARAGLDVTVLEHAPGPGGASSSVEATLPGFVHDHCAGFLPYDRCFAGDPRARARGRGASVDPARGDHGAPVRRRDRDCAAS